MLLQSQLFYVVLNGGERYAFLNFSDDQLFTPQSADNENEAVNGFMNRLGISSQKRAILSPFISNIIKELLVGNEAHDKKVTGAQLNSIMKSTVLKQVLDKKNEVERYDAILNELYEKKEILENIKSDIQAKISKRSRRRLKLLYSLVFLQGVFTQTGTYYMYSWDIMEPITCLFGIFDLFLAYAYWLRYNKEFDFESFETEFQKVKVNSNLKKMSYDEMYLDIQEMIEHIEQWKSLNSEQLPEIMESLDAKFTKL